MGELIEETKQAVTDQGDQPNSEQEVYFDSTKRLLITTCTKCKQQVHFALGSITESKSLSRNNLFISGAA